MKNEYRILIDVIKSALTEKLADIKEIGCIDTLLEISRKHGICVALYYGLHNSEVVIDEKCEKFLRNIVLKEVYHDTQQQFLLDEIKSIFESNNIHFIVLKGSVLKRFYAKSELRRMGDIDILIKNKQYPLIKSIMENAGFLPKGETDHELNWMKSGILVELHKRLIPSYNKDFYSYYGDGWKKAEKKSHNEYVLNPENMFIYLFTHFAKHYRDAGIGITHMCDLWVYMTSAKLDFSYIEAELEKLRLYEFYLNVKNTLAVWFENGQETPVTEHITNHIFDSGIYGAHQNQVLSSALKHKKKYNNPLIERIVIITKTLFPPYSKMRNRNKLLFKMPFLLPLFWIVRWFDLAVSKRNRIHNKINDLSINNQDNISEYEKSLNYVGLDYYF